MSCATAKTEVATRIEYVYPPEGLLKTCENVPLNLATNGEMLMSLIELHSEYQICAFRVNSLVQFFERVQKIEKENGGEYEKL